MFTKHDLNLFKNSVVISLFFLIKIDGKNCNFNVHVKQILRNEGFHRNLSIVVDFASDDVGERWLYEDCLVSIEQILPPGVYATHDEIVESDCKNLLHAIFKTPVNIELPADKSEPVIIHLLSRVREYRTHIYIPVHARYHKAAPGGRTVTNEISVPKVFLLCPNNSLDMCSDLIKDDTQQDNINANKLCAEYLSSKECSWREIPTITVTAPLTWNVPVGNKDHYYLVAISTTIVIIIGSLYLLKTLHEYNIEIRRSGKRKTL